MQYFDPPPLRYVGSKWMLAEWILSQFPPHELYCEPFCGGASVFFRKQPSPIEVLNDLSGDVVNFFTVLRERTDELVRAVELTPYSYAEYQLSYEPASDSLERARRFYVNSRQAFAGGSGRKTGWRRQRNFNRGTSITSEWKRMEGLLMAAARLKDAQIENAPAVKVIPTYDGPHSLFYVDPPYVIKARADAGHLRYTHEMTDDQHRELAEVLHQAEGMVLLSGYDSPLYRELYRDWMVLSRYTTTNGNSQAIEYLWLNHNATSLGSLPLFMWKG